MKRKFQDSGSESNKQKYCDINDDTLFKLVQKLHDLGNYGHHLDSPVLILIGDQNVGKSTIINRFVGLDAVPTRTKKDNEDNTIHFAKTKHPIVFTTGKSEKNYIISCSVIENQTNNLLDNLIPTTIENKNELGINISNYLDSIQNNNSKKSFGSIRIELNIKGPDLQIMHFVDLPGLRQDNPILCNSIANVINWAMGKYTNALFLFTTIAPNYTSTYTWTYINQLPRKENVIWTFTRPDGLGEDDKSLINLIENKNDYNISNSNIFIVKNPDTTDEKQNNLTVDIQNQNEMSYFTKHPLYSKYDDVNKQFGIVNLKNFIIKKLKENLSEQMPSLIFKLENDLKKFKYERSQIADKKDLETESAKKIEYYSQTNKFIEEIRKTFMDGNNDDVIKLREMFTTLFKQEIKQISFSNGTTVEEIRSKILKSGGIDYKVLGYDDKLLDTLLFERNESPYNKLIDCVDMHTEKIFKLIKIIISKINNVDPMIDVQFWEQLKKVTILSFDEKLFLNFFEELCLVQQYHYYDFDELNTNINNTKISEKTHVYDPINTIKKVWEKISNIIIEQFPKVARGFLIRDNINNLESTYKEHENLLLPFVRESPDIKETRNRLDNQIALIEGFNREANLIKRNL
jgi:GTPase Era involved in 16S rRNA processing